ncbi:L-serine ammonia-lyase [Comamonas sp. GB3 AK4-5]|uniref:L-serine ammonia-lyase n=1 Tax=Comamonas sp. GB3 AK4-5 TaxID=3231487 RepID=UPI00351DD2AC
MHVSVFDLFKIGIGPSSSHTVGPMVAALDFALGLQARGLLPQVDSVTVELFGSLAATGIGHATDTAVLLGLAGHSPETVSADAAQTLEAQVARSSQLQLLGVHPTRFITQRQMLLRRKSLPRHPNALRLVAHDAASQLLHEAVYYSVGGGFVEDEAGQRIGTPPGPPLQDGTAAVPYPYANALQLLASCQARQLSIDTLAWANECAQREAAAVAEGLDQIWQVMDAAITRGCAAQGLLPGPLRLPRRAGALMTRLKTQAGERPPDPLAAMDWVNLYAMAVNEENAAGGRVVTAPTNGAAGVIPAVLRYYQRFIPGADATGIRRFLLAAGAIGAIYKRNASLSGAEVGCQGEVGVACSMAAAGLATVLGGTPAQVENAAEIGMEHNLGMTCDPVGGQVQIPCIERNAMGAVKAINAARMALLGDGTHFVSLDQVIRTMVQTGADMKSKYKETSRGGLAVNVVEC